MAGVGRIANDGINPAQIEVVERQRRALELRKAGVGLAEIADELGYSGPSGAAEAIKAALTKTLEAPANELRRLTVSRLDDMLAAVWEHALAGDTDAIATALKIEEKRMKLLGLDKCKTFVETPEIGGEEGDATEENPTVQLRIG